MRTHTAPETTPTATAVPVAPVHRSGRWVDHWDPEDPTLLARRRLGVSGCARQCAEARAKDVGVIATDHGWNLYVGGNGGFTPRLAQLLAEDLDTDTLVRAGDRFLPYEKLQRFGSFVNAPAHADDSFAYVREGGQARPATEAERGDPAALIAGTTLEVRR
jgi:hypothetical protein